MNPSVQALCLWGKKAWKMEGVLWVSNLANGLFLFSFPSRHEAEKVLKSGKRSWQDGELLLDI